MSDFPSLNSLRVFDVAARHLSFKLTADELHLTPTAVSHQIRNLEAWLGVTLFSRQVRQVALTESGIRLAKVTRASLHAIGQTLQELKGQSQGLVIRCTSSFAALWLLPRMAEMQTLLPDTPIEIRSGEQLEPSLSVSTLAIRFGLVANQAQPVTHEHFNLYGTASQLARFEAGQDCPIFLPRWKNTSLPAAPWQTFCQQLASSTDHISLTYFDQELFAIQQAQAGLGLVFSGQTLIKGAAQLKPLADGKPVGSGLGYYLQGHVPNGISPVLSWLTQALA
ncbi:LysR family transcriptional regulator [Bowmanella denitrificans]|uniref:LysR family transcriptional regulator n=1 Tax=Bowmanella denitrificans TaxID=366582 RepID=A0ABP3GUC5_9ALTE